MKIHEYKHVMLNPWITWVRNQQCGYSCPRVKVPGHQYPQCWLSVSNFNFINNCSINSEQNKKLKLRFFPKISPCLQVKNALFQIFITLNFEWYTLLKLCLLENVAGILQSEFYWNILKAPFFIKSLGGDNNGNFIQKCTYTTGIWRNNNVIMTQKRRCDIIITLLRRVSGGYALIYLVELPNSFPTNSVDKWEYIFIKFD